MTCVGDDVVDLDDPDNVRSASRARFVARVCGDVEREALAGAPEPAALLWSFFAAKEAAYKVACKLGPPPVLAHRAFTVDPALTWVRAGDRVLLLRVERGPGWVHAVAWSGEGAPDASVGALAGGSPSDAARALLCARVGGPGLEVVRPATPGSWDGRGPPVLMRDGRPAGLDVSLSHDGRFVACAHAPASSRLMPTTFPVTPASRASPVTRSMFPGFAQ